MPHTHRIQAQRAAGVTAEQLRRGRRARDAAFEDYHEGFGEPAWDALLLLFSQSTHGRDRVSIDELIAETTAPIEMARPYILWLASRKLVSITGEDVELTEPGRLLMIRYLTEPVNDDVSSS